MQCTTHEQASKHGAAARRQEARWRAAQERRKVKFMGGGAPRAPPPCAIAAGWTGVGGPRACRPRTPSGPVASLSRELCPPAALSTGPRSHKQTLASACAQCTHTCILPQPPCSGAPPAAPSLLLLRTCQTPAPASWPGLAAGECCCRQALESFTPRQLRLMFVLQPWEKKMNYGEQVGAALVLLLLLLLLCGAGGNVLRGHADATATAPTPPRRPSLRPPPPAATPHCPTAPPPTGQG